MKLLVLALYAQYRVGAGRMGLWAARNGMRCRTHSPLEALFSWLSGWRGRFRRSHRLRFKD